MMTYLGNQGCFRSTFVPICFGLLDMSGYDFVKQDIVHVGTGLDVQKLHVTK